MKPSQKTLDTLCRLAIEEEVGTGDITTQAIVPENSYITAHFVTRQDCVVCGWDVVTTLYRMLDDTLKLTVIMPDGTKCTAGTRLATITGATHSIIKGERPALGFLKHLSGVSTITSAYKDKLKGSNTQLLDTQETTPGYRELEKYAVRMGGAANYCMGLYNEFTIRGTHRDLANVTDSDDFEHALQQGESLFPGQKLHVETDTLDDIQEALKAQVPYILLKNMDYPTLKKAMALLKETSVKTVACGDIPLRQLNSMLALGLDYVSVTQLTQCVPPIDIALSTQLF